MESLPALSAVLVVAVATAGVVRGLDVRLVLLAAAGVLAPAARSAAALSPKQRVDRAVNGQPVDRPPFSFWHHFGLEKEGPESHARATLAFHRRFHTDFVKVMSDFPYPKPGG